MTHMHELTSAEKYRAQEAARPDHREEALAKDLEEFVRQIQAEDESPASAVANSKPSNLAEKLNAEMAMHDQARKASQSFPVGSVSELPIILHPLDRLTTLMDELRVNGDYYAVRVEYCQLSIMLNLEGKLAPAFRPKPYTGKKREDQVFMSIHRDQVVIDCHWLHSTKQKTRLESKNVDLKPMFDTSKQFPFDLAMKFANQKWSCHHRVVGTLRLSPYQQTQLLTLRAPDVKKNAEALDKASRLGKEYIPSPLSRFEQGMSAWCERDPRIARYRDGYTAVWTARALLGVSASVRQIAEMVGLMTGEAPKDDKTIRAREENLRRHIQGELRV